MNTFEYIIVALLGINGLINSVTLYRRKERDK